MIQKDSVRQRIEREGEGISFTEFTYMILQSLDFAVLNKDYGCTLQIGGSDQWGNITAGIDFIKRKVHGADAQGVTSLALKRLSERLEALEGERRAVQATIEAVKQGAIEPVPAR